jgi:cytochrome c553
VKNPHASRKIAELRGMSEAELIDAHDAVADKRNAETTMNDYRAELARRDAQAQTERMLSLTRFIAGLTVVNVLLVAYTVLH